MEDNIKLEFTNYLSFIGVLNKETSQAFIEQIDSVIKLTNLSFFQLLSQSLALYLSKLTTDDFSQIALSIVLRYSRNKILDHLQPLSKALKRNDQRNMVYVKRRLIKWRHIAYGLKKKDPMSMSMPYAMPASNKPLNLALSATASSQSLTPITTPMQCNKPKGNLTTNTSFRSLKPISSNMSLITASPYQAQSQSQLDIDLNQNTTKSTIMRIMNANRINNTTEYPLTNNSQYDTQFLQRQSSFLITKEKTKQRVKREMKEEHKVQCTFSPKINSSSNNSNKKNKKLKRNHSTFDRLYIDNFERQNKRSIKELELITLIKTEANQYNNKTQYDPKKIEELYEEYKVKERKQKELCDRVNNERGFPFHPCVNSSSSCINTSTSKANRKNKNKNLSFDDTFNGRVQDKENMNYVLEYIKYKEGKEVN